MPVGVDPTKALWRRIFAYLVDGFIGTLIVLALMSALGDVDTQDARTCPDGLPDDRACLDLTSGSVDDDDQQILLIDTSAVPSGSPPGSGGWSSTTCCSRASPAPPSASSSPAPVSCGPTAVARHRQGARAHPAAARRHHLADPAARPLDRHVLAWPPALGDMAAGTYVVKSRYAGRPVVLP